MAGIDNLKPWQPGQSGNPGGKTSAQRKLEVENAEKATRIRAAMLDQVIAAIDAGAVIEINGDTLRLVKDSEDRGLGAPEQHIAVQDNRVATKPLTPDEWAAKHGSG